MFVLQLMFFKWAKPAPFPSYKTIASRMDVTPKMVRRYAAALEAKGYLKREARIGTTNNFHLDSLFQALVTAMNEKHKKKSS